MTDIKLAVDVEVMTFDDLIDIQEGNLKKAKNILVKFAVGPNGKPLLKDEAEVVIGKIPLKDLRQVFTELREQVSAAMDDTFPNGSGPS